MARSEIVPYGSDDDRLPALVWELAEPMWCLSSAPVGGGLGEVDWLLNATVEADFAETDLAAVISQIAAEHNLTGRGVGMLTAADVWLVQRRNDGGVEVEVTVGVRLPTWAASPKDPKLESRDPGTISPGTINTVAIMPAPLSPAAAVNAIMTITEAKTQALVETGIQGTGTASDAVAVLWPTAGEAAQFGGPRSLWGARLARATHAAVAAGVEITR